MIKEYLLENWALLLIAIAFAILLKTTVFLERRKTTRMYALIVSVVLLSVVVLKESDEMMYADKDEYYKKTGLNRPVKE